MLCLSVHLSVRHPYHPVHKSCNMSVIAPVCALSVQPFCTLYVTSVIAPVHALSIQPINTLCVTSVIAPVHASPVPSIHPSDNKHQEFPDGVPGTKYGEKNSFEIMVEFPHDITLTLQPVQFLEETPDTTSRVIYLGNFTSTQIQVKFVVINLRKYMLGVFQVASCTMRCDRIPTKKSLV